MVLRCNTRGRICWKEQTSFWSLLWGSLYPRPDISAFGHVVVTIDVISQRLES